MKFKNFRPMEQPLKQFLKKFLTHIFNFKNEQKNAVYIIENR